MTIVSHAALLEVFLLYLPIVARHERLSAYYVDGLQDIRPLYIGLWAQVLVYFTTSCFVYLHHIKKFVSFQEE